MERNLANIKERILYYTDNKKLAKEKFFENLETTYGNFKGKAKEQAVSSDIIERIIANHPDINVEWLLTGKGGMLKEAVKVGTTENNQKGIPFVSTKVIGGFGNNSFSIEERDVKDFYVIPKFKHKKVDFMIEVEGSSMYPKYNSGDVVACNIINENTFIQWNKTHVIATKEQGIIIKRIKKGNSDNTLCMISDNKDYDAFEIPKDEITGIALVVGVIRLE